MISGSVTALTLGYVFINRTNSASTYNSMNLFATFDVTDTSTHKIRFDYSESHSSTAVYGGSTNYNGTHFTFMRLGYMIKDYLQEALNLLLLKHLIGTVGRRLILMEIKFLMINGCRQVCHC